MNTCATDVSKSLPPAKMNFSHSPTYLLVGNCYNFIVAFAAVPQHLQAAKLVAEQLLVGAPMSKRRNELIDQIRPKAFRQ